MANTQDKPSGPDLTQGVAVETIADGGMIAGRVGEEQVLIARRGEQFFAIGASCSHYSGPLAEGLIVGESVRCPWHHARFDLRTGEAIGAPAFNALACFGVDHRDGKVFVTEKREPQPRRERVAPAAAGMPRRLLIIGGGAAGFAAADMLRRLGFDGSLTILSSDEAAPCDRPNLSKDYLAGTAPEDWIALRPAEFYRDADIDLRLATRVRRLDVRAREVELADARRLAFDKLLLATGAEPVRLAIAGANLPHVHVLRSLGDCRAIIAGAKAARRAVVLGASFIGLEAAASLRTRGLEVHVVAPERTPMVRVLGEAFGQFLRTLHEEHGVVFHLENTAVAIDDKVVRLSSGGSLNADLVVVGIGVQPRVALAEAAGLELDRGVKVDGYLQTSAPDIFAAGDIARWPDRHVKESIRVEHWVVAERQGQAAARNMLGLRQPFTDLPFFWTQHYDVPINYVGHAERFDRVDIDGSIAGRDCLARFFRNGEVLAVASIFRDLASLQAEAAFEAAASK